MMQEKLNDLIGWIAAGVMAAVPLLNWAGIQVTAEMVTAMAADINGWLIAGAGIVAGIKVWARSIPKLS